MIFYIFYICKFIRPFEIYQNYTTTPRRIGPTAVAHDGMSIANGRLLDVDPWQHTAVRHGGRLLPSWRTVSAALI
jgi:hypothetical protein